MRSHPRFESELALRSSVRTRSRLLLRSLVAGALLAGLLGACSSSDPTTEAPAPPATITRPNEPAPDPVPDTGSSSGQTSSSGGPAISCFDDLKAKGVVYEKTTARGVVDAVFVKSKINEVLFAADMRTTPATDPMACEFVQALWRLADVLKAHGIHHVGTLGSYCYRCCCSWSATNFCRGTTDPEPSTTVPSTLPVFSCANVGRIVPSVSKIKARGVASHPLRV